MHMLTQCFINLPEFKEGTTPHHRCFVIADCMWRVSDRSVINIEEDDGTCTTQKSYIYTKKSIK